MSDTDRIKKLEAENKRLKALVADVIYSTGDDPEIMAASRAEWAARAIAAEAKLAKAVEGFNEIRQHCANFGRGVPSIDERIVDRCEETAANAIEYLAGGNDE